METRLDATAIVPQTSTSTSTSTIPEQLSLNAIIIPSRLSAQDPQEQMQNIIREFNKGIAQSCFTTSRSGVRGVYLNPGEVLLGHRNKRAELAAFDRDANIAMVFNLNPWYEYKSISQQDVNSLYYGAFGSYVLNVPPGKYAKAHSGNNPVIYGPGSHVIHDNNFRFNPKNGLIDQAQYYIQHDTLHILRVPNGSVATIWIGSKSYILEANDEPYVFRAANFMLIKKNEQAMFYSTTDEVITHGTSKRFMPQNRNVVVCFEGSHLEIIKPKDTIQPTLITDRPLLQYIGILNTGTQQLKFPSNRTKEEKKRDNPSSNPDEIAYEICNTKDSLKIGIVSIVTFEISDPHKAMSRLTTPDQVAIFIENQATIIMRQAIQHSTSQEYLNASRINVEKLEEGNGGQFIQHIQQEAQELLGKQLEKLGIHLIGFNIEHSKIIDVKITEQLEEQSMITAKANAQISALQQQTQIALTQAERHAKVAQIEQEQKNKATVSAAETRLKEAELDAAALKVHINAKNEASLMQSKAWHEDPKIYELERLKAQTKVFSKNPIFSMYNMAGSPLIFGANQAQQPLPMATLTNVSSNDSNVRQVSFNK